jgi:hypothetical protein
VRGRKVSTGPQSTRYRARVPSESFFMAMAGLGVSLAGFAGLISALDRRPMARSPEAAYRITGIIFLGFALTIAGLGTVVAWTVTGQNLSLTLQVGSLLLVIPLIRGFLQARPGPAWSSERERWTVIAGLSVLTAVTLGNVVVANLGYLQLLMLGALIGPIQIFYNTVRDAARGDLVEAEADAQEPSA